MSMRWALLLLLLAGPAAQAADLPPIRIGLVVPATSEAGPVAQSMRRAAEMAVADWTPRLGRPLELRVKDDQFDPKQAVITAEKLIQEGVWGVVGHYYSSSSIPASAVYAAADVPLVTPTSTHPRLTSQGFDNVFRVSGRDDQQAVTAADFALETLKARRIAIVHDQTEYGSGLAETFERTLWRRASKRVVLTEMLAQGDKDFTSQVTALKAARPDLVYYGGIFREAGYLVRQMRQAGLTATFLSGDAVLDTEFVRLAGEDAASGTYLTFYPDPRRLDSAGAFRREFESRYGSLGPYVLYTYDAMGVLLQGISTAKAVDNSPESLRRVIRAIRGRPYKGVLGTLRWDKNGDLAASPYVVYLTKRGGDFQGWFEQLPSPAKPKGAP
jgi:branched-chain amino acid transport system substrate-binding protein